MLHDPAAQSASERSANDDGPRDDASRIAGALSPSLLGAARAYELKFLLSEQAALAIEAWAGQNLMIDPHAEAALGNAYRIHSLYLDTAELDVFQRSPSYGRRKFRLRRYGNENVLFLERKTKSGQRVRKRRTLIPDIEIELLQAAAVDPAWSGSWFHQRLLSRRLQPTCRISYDRVAYVGADADGPLRLTLDRRIHAAPASTWVVAQPEASLPLLPGQVVLELKYRTVVPTLFKRFMQEFNLNPQPASKYRLGIEAWSLDKAAKEAG